MSAITELRVGVIGTGIMGADHAQIIDSTVARARVSRVCDVDLAKAEAVARTLRCGQTAPEAYALIADPEVDAVLVASSDDTHADLVIAALAAEKPVLCEKPLAPSLAEAKRAIAAAPEAASLLTMGFMRRFDPGYVGMKEALEAGDLGAPLIVHCFSRGVTAAQTTPSEYALIGAAVHEFDVVPWLLGAPITEVYWLAPRSSRHTPNRQDPQVVLLRTRDGALTTVDIFLSAQYGFEVRCEVLTEQGTVELSPAASITRRHDLSVTSALDADWRTRFADAYRLQAQAWVDRILDGTPSQLATAYDGLAAAAVSQAAITSMESGGWVAVDYSQVTQTP